jgi:hypothetical protein
MPRDRSVFGPRTQAANAKFLATIGLGMFVWQFNHAAKAAEVFTQTDGFSFTYSNPIQNAVGSINGVKLSIPANYLMGGVEYKKNNEKSIITKRSTPTFDSEINDFGIRLRLSNLEPIMTDNDWQEWLHPEKMHSHFIYEYEIWTIIGIYPGWYAPDGSLKSELSNWARDDSHWGPFVNQPKQVYGLKHSTSVQTPDGHRVSGQYEYFYDDVTWATFIYCKTSRQQVPPFDTFTTCHHDFIVPEIKAVADAIYTKKDLERWRTIEKKTKALVHSFIVK